MMTMKNRKKKHIKRDEKNSNYDFIVVHIFHLAGSSLMILVWPFVGFSAKFSYYNLDDIINVTYTHIACIFPFQFHIELSNDSFFQRSESGNNNEDDSNDFDGIRRE